MDISTVPPAYSRPVAVGKVYLGADLALVHEIEHARTDQGIDTDRHGSNEHRQPGDIFPEQKRQKSDEFVRSRPRGLGSAPKRTTS